jgi:hypothetical protein
LLTLTFFALPPVALAFLRADAFSLLEFFVALAMSISSSICDLEKYN